MDCADEIRRTVEVWNIKFFPSCLLVPEDLRFARQILSELDLVLLLEGLQVIEASKVVFEDEELSPYLVADFGWQVAQCPKARSSNDVEIASLLTPFAFLRLL